MQFLKDIPIIYLWLRDIKMKTTPSEKSDLHYNDVIMSAMACQITSLSIVTQPFIQTQIKENIKAPRHWPLWGGFTGDRWIPLTKGQ